MINNEVYFTGKNLKLSQHVNFLHWFKICLKTVFQFDRCGSRGEAGEAAAVR